jgi:hypothetical protein
VESGAAEHLALEHLDPVDVAFDSARVPRQGEACGDGGEVAADSMATMANTTARPVDSVLRYLIFPPCYQATVQLPYLMRWIRKKYKRLRPFHKALACWQRITRQHPRLFAHWAWVHTAW